MKDEFAVKSVKGNIALSDAIRDLLHDYILRDWKKRIDVAVSWLNEEWYNDMLSSTLTSSSPQSSPKSKPQSQSQTHTHTQTQTPTYTTHALRLLDALLPYVAPTDKGLIRLYSELPSLDYALLARVKTMAQDPERVSLATQVLQYLHMFRPPVKRVVEDVVSELWRENERARPKAGALLRVWRPEVLGEMEGVVGGKVEG